MARFVFLILFALISNFVSGHATLMYISARPITCLNHAYEIEISQLSYTGSSIIFGGMEVIYGDGVVEEFPDDDFQTYTPDNGQAIIKYVKKHVFQGPGVYKINARFFNRTADIRNMENSVNTPYYVSTVLTIDPYLGCNTTPILENFPHKSKNGFTYFHDFSFLDAENDSLSFNLTTPMQSRFDQVINYALPSDGDSTGQPISRISLDYFNGSILLNSRYSTGDYTVAFQVLEWRKVDGEYFLMSKSTLDFEFTLNDGYVNYAHIEEVNDTVILAGQSFEISREFSDPEEDSIQVNIYGDFNQLCNPTSQPDFNFYPGPIKKEIRLTPIIDHVRQKPYKLIFAVNDKPHENSSAINYSKSTYIWITDKECTPLPPKNFTGQSLSTNLINLYWNDSQDELGYILERASQHFPEFVRLAVLPINSTFYNDSSVVDNVTYQYRIKAVGTVMSDYKYVEVTTPDIITGIEGSMLQKEINIYPNPSTGQFFISAKFKPDVIEISGVDGKVVWYKCIKEPSLENALYKVDHQLNSGIYFLRLVSVEKILSKKIIVN